MKIIYKDGTVAECPAEEAQHVLRHTAAHIMAQAIQHLYPDADFAYGPATEKGFYYDVDFGDKKLTDEDRKRDEEDRQGKPAHQALHPAPGRGRQAHARPSRQV